ncbi:MAG: hypothetical protein J6M93_07405 [Succinivibrio sp.]|nr:hypothetical protein [Succinivibrio sp.]
MTSSAAALALNQGADTASAALSNLATSGIRDVQAFSAVGGGAARVETGSHVNISSLNFSVGIGDNHESYEGAFLLFYRRNLTPFKRQINTVVCLRGRHELQS